MSVPTETLNIGVPAMRLHRMNRALAQVLRAARALDDHWIGDLLGAISLFALGWMWLVIGWVLQ